MGEEGAPSKQWVWLVSGQAFETIKQILGDQRRPKLLYRLVVVASNQSPLRGHAKAKGLHLQRSSVLVHACFNVERRDDLLFRQSLRFVSLRLILDSLRDSWRLWQILRVAIVMSSFTSITLNATHTLLAFLEWVILTGSLIASGVSSSNLTFAQSSGPTPPLSSPSLAAALSPSFGPKILSG